MLEPIIINNRDGSTLEMSFPLTAGLAVRIRFFEPGGKCVNRFEWLIPESLRAHLSNPFTMKIAEEILRQLFSMPKEG